MEIVTALNTGNLALADPTQVHLTVDPSDPESLGPRVLELGSVLQTTLELDEIFRLFAREMYRNLNIDGIDYLHPLGGTALESGKINTHRATYDLKIDEKHLGCVRLYRTLPFTVNELAGLENLLCALVYPLKNSLDYAAAVQLAMHDRLTGAHNRMAFEEALPREVELASRQDTPLSILMIDADHFKHFNDTYGHAFGDDVLRAIADAAHNTVRRSDLLYRYGGEELVVLAANTDPAGAKLLAERIRENIASIKSIRGQEVSVTVSVGVATLQKGEHPQSLFDRADNAVYMAKDAGRNTVVIS